MKILPDECAPRVVKKLLPGRDIRTVQEMGWAGLKNGELLAAANGQFDVFITTDKSLRYQQNLTKYGLAVILLPSNSAPDVETIISNIDAALEAIQTGHFIELQLP